MERAQDPHTVPADMDGVVLDGAGLTLEQMEAVARRRARVELSQDQAVRGAIDRSREVMLAQLERGSPIYGVTTGVGDSARYQVGLDRAAAMQRLLVRKCGCGTGPELSAEQVRAAILVRANCLSKGNSGVRPVLIERLCDLLNLDLLPQIPAQGSVGASGDLVPASYIAAALIGERPVQFRGRRMPAADAWAEVGLEPLVLQPKEGLALLNGTHVTAGIGSLVLLGAQRLVRIAEVTTAMACEALGAIDGPFHPFFEQVKRHPGLAASTDLIRWSLTGSRMVRSYGQVADELPPLTTDGWRELPARVQDNYSLRCAPHCTGALRDCLTWARQWLRDRDQLDQRQPAVRRCVGHRPQRRQLLRLPRRPGHGQLEDRDRQRGGPGRPAVRLAGGREAQQRPDAEPGGAAAGGPSRARHPPRLQGRAAGGLGADRGGPAAHRCR